MFSTHGGPVRGLGENQIRQAMSKMFGEMGDKTARIYNAVDGALTDTDEIRKILQSLKPEERKQVEAIWELMFKDVKGSLLNQLRSETSGQQEREFVKLLTEGLSLEDRVKAIRAAVLNGDKESLISLIQPEDFGKLSKKYKEDYAEHFGAKLQKMLTKDELNEVIRRTYQSSSEDLIKIRTLLESKESGTPEAKKIFLSLSEDKRSKINTLYKFFYTEGKEELPKLLGL
jgi:hypothetical protein